MSPTNLRPAAAHVACDIRRNIVLPPGVGPEWGRSGAGVGPEWGRSGAGVGRKPDVRSCQ